MVSTDASRRELLTKSRDNIELKPSNRDQSR